MCRKNYQAVNIVWCCIILFSCKNKTDYTLPPDASGKKVFVVCEGAYGTGNSALSLYLPAKDSVFEDVYYAANQQKCGDVFQSMVHIGSNYFLCINNSDKILIIDDKNWKLKMTINVSKPRYILKIAGEKAYVSSLYSDKLYIINPQTMQVTGNISMPAKNSEGMLLYNNKVFACNWDTATKKIFSVDIADDKISEVASLDGYAPQEIIADKEGMLWVLSGNVSQGKTAFLTRINPSTNQIISSYSFPQKADPLRLVSNSAKDSIYFLEVNYNGGTENNGVYRMNIHDANLPSSPFIAAKQYQYFWGLDIDVTTGNIYIADPKGFTQKGVVYIYKPDKTLVAQFNTGIGPGHFYFEE